MIRESTQVTTYFDKSLLSKMEKARGQKNRSGFINWAVAKMLNHMVTCEGCRNLNDVIPIPEMDYRQDKVEHGHKDHGFHRGDVS